MSGPDMSHRLGNWFILDAGVPGVAAWLRLLRPIYTGSRPRRTLPWWPGRRMTGPLTRSVAGGVFDAPYLWRDSRSTCNPEGVLLFGCWLGTAN